MDGVKVESVKINLKNNCKSAGKYLLTFLKWFALAAVTGAVGGAVFNIFIGSLLATMGNVLFAVMGVMHLVTAVILWRMVRHETPKNVK